MEKLLVHCAFCGAESPTSLYPNAHLLHEIDCPLCGNYGLDRVLYIGAVEQQTIQIAEKRLFAGFVREQNDLGRDRPLLTAAQIESLAMALPRSPNEKAQKLLLAIGRFVKFGDVAQLKYEQWLARGYAENPGELLALTKLLAERGFITNSTNTRAGAFVAITAEGVDEITRLERSKRKSEVNTQDERAPSMNPQHAMPNAVSPEVFVVHGHDEEMKQTVARVLERLLLSPIILHDQPNRGSTLIEKFERNTDVTFAIILLSPDDIGYANVAGPTHAKPRARQNVILELGYFFGKLGRDRVFALKRGDDLDLPTDFSGVVYTPYDAAGHWRFELVRELNAAKINVDANRLISGLQG